MVGAWPGRLCRGVDVKDAEQPRFIERLDISTWTLLGLVGLLAAVFVFRMISLNSLDDPCIELIRDQMVSPSSFVFDRSIGTSDHMTVHFEGTNIYGAMIASEATCANGAIDKGTFEQKMQRIDRMRSADDAEASEYTPFRRL